MTDNRKIMKAQRKAMSRLWGEVWNKTGIDFNPFYSLVDEELNIREVYRCDADSWPTVIQSLREFEIPFTEAFEGEIEIPVPGEGDLVLKIWLCHYETPEFDYSDLDGMLLPEAIIRLQAYAQKPVESFDYIVIGFNKLPIETGLQYKMLTFPPSDPRFRRFLEAAKQNLPHTARAFHPPPEWG